MNTDIIVSIIDGQNKSVKRPLGKMVEVRIKEKWPWCLSLNLP